VLCVSTIESSQAGCSPTKATGAPRLNSPDLQGLVGASAVAIELRWRRNKTLDVDYFNIEYLSLPSLSVFQT
jgi:hypothetical protein